jgi:hypothetical protein
MACVPVVTIVLVAMLIASRASKSHLYETAAGGGVDSEGNAVDPGGNSIISKPEMVHATSIGQGYSFFKNPLYRNRAVQVSGENAEMDEEQHDEEGGSGRLWRSYSVDQKRMEENGAHYKVSNPLNPLHKALSASPSRNKRAQSVSVYNGTHSEKKSPPPQQKEQSSPVVQSLKLFEMSGGRVASVMPGGVVVRTTEL